LIVLSPTLGGETQPLIDRVQEVVRSRGGQIDASHDWGSKKLAHPIQKQTDGRYFLIEYQAEGDAVAEVERTLRITDGVLRYITVQQEHTGLPQPRVRESYRREDTPLSEMRSMGAESEGGGAAEPAGEPGRAEQAEKAEPEQAEPAEQAEQTERTE
jgi:small subunit ribosomal protein S6